MEIGKDYLILDTIRAEPKSYSISLCNSLRWPRMLTMQEERKCLLLIFFSAMELLVQSMLFVVSKQNYVDNPNHRWTMSEFSTFVKLRNMDPKSIPKS
jgi:hypothetical protein